MNLAQDFFSLLGLGISAFIASNIDDTFILILLFSSPSFQIRHIIVGQFAGIGVLIMLSALGALIALVIPTYFMGLMGLIPVGIGIMKLIELKEKTRIQSETKTASEFNQGGMMPYFAVSGITISNGGDDLGVFTPLFAKYNNVGDVVILISILMGMTLIWCIVTLYFTHHPLITGRIKYYGSFLTPFVLMGIGVYILADSFF